MASSLVHWFTSDWHLFNKNFLNNLMRQGFKSVEDMNDYIIEKTFEMIKPGDNLYFLGDMGWGFPKGYLDSLFLRFKKHKINFFWIEGNHDASIKVDSSCIKWKGQIKDIEIEKQPITLCHYPLIVWNKSHYGAWNLFGHIHYDDNTWNKMNALASNALLNSKRLNVNTELYFFRPLSFESIRQIFEVDGKGMYRNFDLI